MSKFSQKWCIIAFIDTVAKGSEFLARDWPLHCTIAPAFNVDLTEQALVTLFRGIDFDIKHSYVAGKEVIWGSTTVNLVTSPEDFTAAHHKVISALQANSLTFVEPQYTGDNNTPHVTAQRSGRVYEGESFTIVSIGLIDMFPEGNHRMRRVLELVEFSK